MAHDRRTGDERWAWLAAIPEADVERGADRARVAAPVSMRSANLPAVQRIGDLVVYAGETTGVLFGLGEVVGEPQPKPDETDLWRLRIRAVFLLDPGSAPSLGDVGLTVRRLMTRLDSEQYERVRQAMVRAVATSTEAPSGMASESPPRL